MTATPLTLASGAFTVTADDGGSPKLGRYLGVRVEDGLKVLISTRSLSKTHGTPEWMAWSVEGLVPVLFRGPVDPGPAAQSGSPLASIIGVVEILPPGTRLSDRAGQWSVQDCARIGVTLCGMAVEAWRDEIELFCIRPDVVFVEQGQLSGVTGRSFLHLGWGEDARLPGPYRDIYIAPEIGELEATPRSDVFSIGCTLWMAACNEYPFTSTTLAVRKPFRGPRELEALLGAATMHAPGDRPSLEEMQAELGKLAAG